MTTGGFISETGAMTSPTSVQAPYQPWFNRHPGLALVGIAVLFVLITALRLALGADAVAGVALFYVVPISLAAMAWGRRGGVIAACVALALLALWVLVDDVTLTPLGWAARVVPILISGLLLGDASDRLRVAEEAHLRQVEKELQHRQAVEVNDSLLQGMSAAKWALEVGNHELGIKALDDTIRAGQTLVSDLIRESGMGPVEPRS